MNTTRLNATAPAYNAFVADIDLKEHPIKDKQRLYDHIMNVFKTYNFYPTFIVESV